MTDTAVAAPHPRFRVQRWTPVSLLFTGGLSGLVVALAFGRSSWARTRRTT